MHAHCDKFYFISGFLLFEVVSVQFVEILKNMAFSSIPVIDMGKLSAEMENIRNDSEWMSVAEKIRQGLGSVGFMYLTNHGIPSEAISNVFSQSEQFFGLEPELKLKYLKNTNPINSGTSKTFAIDNYFGYTPPGVERLHPEAKLELKETYDWLDRRGVYPDKELPEFEKSFARLDAECKQFLKGKLLKLLAMSLGMEDVDFFVKCCRHFDQPEKYTGLYNMRVLHYPPLNLDDGQTKSEGTVRLGEHSDYGFVTLLFQDDTGGLEVKNVNGEWVQATPIPGSVLVNTGDLVEFWTCGIFPATPHRVGVPKKVDPKRNKSRYSVVFFNGPDSDTIVRPLDLEKKPVESERLQKMGKVYSKEPVNAYEYEMGRIASQYS